MQIPDITFKVNNRLKVPRRPHWLVGYAVGVLVAYEPLRDKLD